MLGGRKRCCLLKRKESAMVREWARVRRKGYLGENAVPRGACLTDLRWGRRRAHPRRMGVERPVFGVFCSSGGWVEV